MIIVDTEFKEIPQTCADCPAFRKFTGIGNPSVVEYGDSCDFMSGYFMSDAIEDFESRRRYHACPLQEIKNLGGKENDE